MLLEADHVSKSFHGAAALRDVCLGLRPGEIHGLVGENGAGKSTLIKLLTGVYPLRQGRFLWDGAPVSLSSPAESRRLGIQVIHQDRTLIPTFDGVENAYLGLPYPTRHGRVDWTAMTARVEETADRLGISLDLRKTAAELSPPQRTCLEIIRSQMTACRLLVLDEPTAALTDRESEQLFSILQTLRSRNVAILYVSHRLEEIFRLTDRVTVLRSGAVVDTVDTAAVTQSGLVSMMTDGGAVGTIAHRQSFGPALLEARGVVSRDGAVKDGSLTVRSGEILGLFGLGGSGRTELLECLYGCRSRTAGRVTLCGAVQTAPTPGDSLRRGMALIAEDRRGKAMLPALSVRENVTLSALGRFVRRGVVRPRAETAAVQAQIDSLHIQLTGQDQPMAELSGGNQQKVVFARVLLTNPRVLLCDEPTQAVDPATRSALHRLLRQKADEGCAIVFVSSDLTEVLEVADTVQVMVRGRTGPSWNNEGLTPRQVLSCCYGTSSEEEPLS